MNSIVISPGSASNLAALSWIILGAMRKLLMESLKAPMLYSLPKN